MTAQKPIEVSAGIFYRDGMLLAAQRPEGKPWAGYWEFPGGKGDDGETPEETLRRELAEELGVKIRECRILKTIDHDYGDHVVRLSFFLIAAYDGAPSPEEEQNVRWISPRELDELQFLPADTELLNLLKNEAGALPWQGAR